MRKIDIPIVVGPGSQPADDDGLRLDYLRMPSGMATYAMPDLPEPEELVRTDEALAVLHRIHAALTTYRVGASPLALSLDHLDERNTELVNQVLGSGEVSIKYRAATEVRIQESVLAGVWRVQCLDEAGSVERDWVEIANIPRLVGESSFAAAPATVPLDALEVPDSVNNAVPLLTEINDRLASAAAASVPHVINLSLLPHTDDDIGFLVAKLGDGPVVILSRGYGNCRISSTGTRNVWWVQYFNSQDTLILNTLEIIAVPEVACAAQEDIDDSAQRLGEILEIYG